MDTIPVADPGFPQGGDANSPGAPTYDFAKFSQKLHEIERIWIPRGRRVPRARLRSATDYTSSIAAIITCSILVQLWTQSLLGILLEMEIMFGAHVPIHCNVGGYFVPLDPLLQTARLQQRQHNQNESKSNHL